MLICSLTNQSVVHIISILLKWLSTNKRVGFHPHDEIRDVVDFEDPRANQEPK